MSEPVEKRTGSEREPDSRTGTNDYRRTRSHPKMWLSDLSIRQPVFITMLVLAVMVVGGISYSRMGLELFPDISLPVAVVQTAYPGAGPEEIERSVTRPIEDAVASINGVETIRSTSMESLSLVIVQFEMSRDAKDAAEEVRTRVNAVRNALPSDTQEPQILRFDFGAAPILSLAISDSTGRTSLEELRAMADDMIKPRLERLDGVAAVEIVGGPVREVHVELDRAQLEAHRVPPQQVAQAIRSHNLEIPAGRIPEAGREELLRTDGVAQSLEELADVPVIGRPDGTIVRVRNVARVGEGYAETRSLTRLDGQDSVVASVRKQSGANTVRVADEVKAELETLQRDYPGIELAIAFDQSTFTRESVEDVQTSLLLGALLAALIVLLFFRDFRNTLVTVAGLPVVLLGTFAVMRFVGISLNMISLMGLSLSVGMLIDDAIVVRENIFRRTERGEDPKTAAGRGTAEIALAVVAVTSTIVAVFLPIAFTEGLAGEFLRDFGVTVAVAVLISLVEAFTLAPLLSAHFFRSIQRPTMPAPEGTSEEASSSRGSVSLAGGMASGYARVLRWSLRHRLVVVGLALLALVGAGLVFSRLAFSLTPRSDQGDFGVSVELSPGTALAETDRVVRDMEDVLRAEPEVAHVFTTVGSTTGAVEAAALVVQLRERGRTEAFIARLRPRLEAAAGAAKLTVDPESNDAMFGGGAAVGAVRGRPIQFSVTGEDLETLDRVSADLVERLKQVPGLVDVDRSLKPRRPGQSIVLDRAKAADHGVSPGQAGATLRALIAGEKAGTYRRASRDVDIVVRLDEADRQNLADVLRLTVVTPTGKQVTLSDVASLADSPEPSVIERESRLRQVLVGGGFEGRDAGSVLADARRVAEETSLPEGVAIKVTGQAESQDEMLSSLGLALGLSVLFVYMILASQFGSFVHPFTIMLALPLSLVGALLALFAFGFNFDMLAMIGIILLMGLVAKNSILLVEFANQSKRRGLSATEAIVEAGRVRLRPILMTTLAMIFGMIPVAVGIGSGAELRQPMGVAVIGGLLTSTLLTLLVVPVAYTLVDDLGRLVVRREAPSSAEREDQALNGPRAFAWSFGSLLVMVAAGGFWLLFSATSDPAPAGPTLETAEPQARAEAPRVEGLASPVELTEVEPAPTPGTPPAAMPGMPPSSGPLPAQVPAAPPTALSATSPPPAASSAAGQAPTGGGVAIANTSGRGANVRSAPGLEASRITALPEGARLKPLGETAQASGRVWVKVQDSRGTVGWIAQELLAGGSP